LIEGRPIKIRVKAGIMVQNSSSGGDSLIFLSILILATIEYMLNPTIEMMRIRIVIAWS
jgi:hypothetical protein